MFHKFSIEKTEKPATEKTRKPVCFVFPRLLHLQVSRKQHRTNVPDIESAGGKKPGGISDSLDTLHLALDYSMLDHIGLAGSVAISCSYGSERPGWLHTPKLAFSLQFACLGWLALYNSS